MTRNPFPAPAFLFGLLGLATLILGGACSTGRTSTTTRTAVEQALISQSVEESISKMKLDAIAGKRYVIKKDFCSAVDCEYILGSLNRRILELGATAEDEKSSNTQVEIYPMVAHSGVDDSSILIGLPNIPLAMPGVGAITIPETAFFKHVTQSGRNRMSVFAKDRKTGQLLFATDTVTSQRFYDRWVVLFVFNFRTTDLALPH